MFKNLFKRKKKDKVVRDTKGNVTYRKTEKGEYWYRQSKCIHSKIFATGVEDWHEYDNKGRCNHYKNSEGREYWCDYDNEGRMIHSRTNTGYEEWSEYKDGILISYKNNQGLEVR